MKTTSTKKTEKNLETSAAENKPKTTETSSALFLSNAELQFLKDLFSTPNQAAY